MLLGGTALILIYAFSTPGSHWSYVGVGMLTALAALLTGFLAGFLVGVPKVVSSGRRQQVRQVTSQLDMFSPSTNLAEISDWLTKLLLGAGLVSLSHLGGPVGRLIDNVAGGLHGTTSDPATIQAAKVFAGAVMIAFTALGVLVGYVITSTWYQSKINEYQNKIIVYQKEINDEASPPAQTRARYRYSSRASLGQAATGRSSKDNDTMTARAIADRSDHPTLPAHIGY